MINPVAVIISDLHFTPATLELASKALRMAQARAVELHVPLIIAGDTLDSKAVMRAECVNRLIEIFQIRPAPVETIVLIGNHDLLNEKGYGHSLEFLKPYVHVCDYAVLHEGMGILLVPYQTDIGYLKSILPQMQRRPIIMHQGVQTAYMGHYTQDKTSLPKEAFADFRVISGHYHRRQDIVCASGWAENEGGVGLFSYIGNPYTQNFGEASDPEKGFRVLYEDGSLGFVPTNLRKHVVIDINVGELPNGEMPVKNDDLIWLKLRGPKSALDGVDKKQLGLREFGHDNYKLELIPTEAVPIKEDSIQYLSESELFDTIIDATSDTNERKTYLKGLWRETLADT